MEPNKLENQFKTQLNSREIKPSEMAWDRLDAMLTVAEKPKRNFKWMYIAASFLGFIFIATVFLSQTENVTDKEKVVFGKENNLKNLKNQNHLKNQKNLNELNNQNQVSYSPPLEGSGEVSIINQKTNQKNLSNENNQKNDNQVVQNSTINTSSVRAKFSGQKTEQNPTLFETNKKSQTVVAIGTLDANDEAIVANLTPKQIEYSKIKINPNDLLSQVDGELELTFREKVIQSVSKNFKSIKVAVQNRNN